jgi:predicted lipid-binding transport protein (Tim44 family)
MEELIQRVAAATGVAPDKVQTAIGMIFAFLQKEGPKAEVDKLLAELPGAPEAVAKAAANQSPGGFLAGLMGAMGGGGGLMGLASQLMGQGLGMNEIQAIGKEVFAFAEEKVGKERLSQIVAAVPGLSQFVELNSQD